MLREGGAPQIRTWLITEVAAYLPPDARDPFLRGASAGLRELLGRPPGDRDAWAPLGLFIEALELADRISGRGDLSACWSIGRFTASHEMGVVRSFALKLLRPPAIISLSTSLWSVHYRSAGRAAAQGIGPAKVAVSIVDFPTPHRAHCLAVGGWMQGALELGPRRGIQVAKVSCRCEGAPTCDFHVEWAEP